MENVRKQRDAKKLRTKWDGQWGVRKLISSPFFKHRTIFNEDFAAIEMLKSEIKLCKPIIIGMSILEISKICMYKFHYNHMKPKYIMIKYH